MTANKRATATEVNNCSDGLAIFLGSENERLGRSKSVCVKCCFRLGKTATEKWKMLQQAFGDKCMSRTQCFERYRRFKTGRTSIDEDPRSGRVSISTEDVHIDAVCDLILQNRRLTIREIDDDVGISFGSFQAILTEKLNMHRVAAKFVPRVLTEDQKANRVNISQELLDRVSVDENNRNRRQNLDLWL
jgi:hypothetical protein